MDKPSYCAVCKDIYCDVCWDKYRPHSRKVVTSDGVGRSHEKITAGISRILELQRIIYFGANQSFKQLRTLHLQDLHTKWFRVSTSEPLGDSSKSERQQLCTPLETTRRVENLLEPITRGNGASIYPSIVAFVGESGAGKSTLIKALIEVCDDNSIHGFHSSDRF